MQGKLANFFKPSHPSKAGNITSARRRKLLFSYAPDWILTIALAAIFLSLDKVDGYRRVFSLEDTSLRHPYTVHERVPNEWLYVTCGAVPLVTMALTNFFTVRSWWDLHNSYLGLTLGLALTGSMTQFVKITVGRPRPDIIARCIPPPGATDPQFGLTSWTICTQTDNKMLRDGFRSFFSGHSSLSFAGLGFLSFYLAGKLHLFDKRGHTGKAWVALMPFSAAALIAISRSMDYRHHWHDILVGSLVGTLFAFFAYHQYYPSLSSELSHRPYSPRIKDDSAGDDDSTAGGHGGAVLPLHLGNGSTSSGFKPNASTSVAAVVAPLNNRYNTTPSPPMGHHQTAYTAPPGGGFHSQQSSGTSGPNPFVHPSQHTQQSSGGGYGAGAGTAHGGRDEEGYTEASYELDGTVPRPGGQMWGAKGSGVDGTVPRGGGDDDDGDEDPYGGYRRETRLNPNQQQRQQTSGLT